MGIALQARYEQVRGQAAVRPYSRRAHPSAGQCLGHALVCVYSKIKEKKRSEKKGKQKEGKTVKGCLVLGTSWILTWGCRVSSVIAMGVWGWYCPCRDEDLASRLPMSQTRHQRARHRQCGAHMGASQDFSVKTCFLAFLCPIRPGSPAPSRDHREAAGTYRDQQ